MWHHCNEIYGEQFSKINKKLFHIWRAFQAISGRQEAEEFAREPQQDFGVAGGGGHDAHGGDPAPSQQPHWAALRLPRQSKQVSERNE